MGETFTVKVTLPKRCPECGSCAFTIVVHDEVYTEVAMCHSCGFVIKNDVQIFAIEDSEPEPELKEEPVKHTEETDWRF